MNFHDSTHDDVDNLVHSRARDYVKRFGFPWAEHGLDLVQIGWLGAARASSRYEARGWKFLSYAYWFIDGDIRRACTKLAYERNHVEALDASHDLAFEDDPDFDAALRELLASSDGLELLALELGYLDRSRQGARIRKKQLDQLRARYERLRRAA